MAVHLHGFLVKKFVLIPGRRNQGHILDGLLGLTKEIISSVTITGSTLKLELAV
jgi:hypothetical protein